jgi:hypothetical protein
MRILLAGPAILALALAALPAAADWEYTKWGMKPEEVAQASKGTVKVLPLDRRKKLEEANMEHAAEGSFTEGKLKLAVRFGFALDTKGLVCVIYAVETKEQNALLKEALIRKYGPPATTGGLPVIGLESANWKQPDDIDLEMMKDSPAFVMHCKQST